MQVAAPPVPVVELANHHIAKCGGYSIGAMIAKSYSSGLVQVAGAESCLRALPMNPANESSRLLRLTTLRHPRSHVVSQYLFCHHWREGQRPPLHDAFPIANASSAGGAAEGFRRWLQHFDPRAWRHADADPPRTGPHNDYACCESPRPRTSVFCAITS